MNERQPYEHRIAEKLQQLSSPDVESSWQKMKRLLDDNESSGAGGGRNGPGAWWRTGLIAIVLMTSLWLYTENKKSSEKVQAAENVAIKKPITTNDNTTTRNTSSNISNKKSTSKDIAANENKKQVSENHIQDENINAAAANRIIADQKNAGTDKTISSGDKKVKQLRTITADRSIVSNEPANTALPIDHNTDESAKRTLSINSNTSKINNNNINNGKKVALNDDVAFDQKTISHTSIGKQVKGNGNPIPVENKFNKNQSTYVSKNNKQKANTAAITINDNITEESIRSQQNNWYELLTGLTVIREPVSINTSLSAGQNIQTEIDGNTILSKETKDRAKKVSRDYEIAVMTKKEKKSLKLNLSNVFKPFSLHVDAEPWWAAGLALNNSVAVNAQNRYNYNINAKSGVLGDYIPSPYVQFHLNDYVYMQTELNLSTPQLTPQLLLYQNSTDLAGAAGISQQKSIYVQKLYYFNWPVSLHYSPINNLYFAAGLQFSSFQSGLALIQNKKYVTQGGNPNDPVSTENFVEKFKDDSLAAKLSPTEWRWQTGADYYWNRVTIGLRYNKAFKDLLNVNVSSSLPLTTNRNSAFLFFMRYNLFEGRNKNTSGSKGSLVRY